MFYQWLKTVFYTLLGTTADQSNRGKGKSISLNSTISKMNANYDTNKELSKELSSPLNVNVSF